MLKNAHLLCSPHPSPCRARGRLIATYVQVHLTPQDFACLREAASAKAGAPRIWAFLSILKNNGFFNNLIKTLRFGFTRKMGRRANFQRARFDSEKI